MLTKLGAYKILSSNHNNYLYKMMTNEQVEFNQVFIFSLVSYSCSRYVEIIATFFLLELSCDTFMFIFIRTYSHEHFGIARIVANDSRDRFAIGQSREMLINKAVNITKNSKVCGTVNINN